MDQALAYGHCDTVPYPPASWASEVLVSTMHLLDMAKVLFVLLFITLCNTGHAHSQFSWEAVVGGWGLRPQQTPCMPYEEIYNE